MKPMMQAKKYSIFLFVLCQFIFLGPFSAYGGKRERAQIVNICSVLLQGKSVNPGLVEANYSEIQNHISVNDLRKLAENYGNLKKEDLNGYGTTDYHNDSQLAPKRAADAIINSVIDPYVIIKEQLQSGQSALEAYSHYLTTLYDQVFSYSNEGYGGYGIKELMRILSAVQAVALEKSVNATLSGAFGNEEIRISGSLMNGRARLVGSSLDMFFPSFYDLIEYKSLIKKELDKASKDLKQPIFLTTTFNKIHASDAIRFSNVSRIQAVVDVETIKIVVYPHRGVDGNLSADPIELVLDSNEGRLLNLTLAKRLKLKWLKDFTSKPPSSSKLSKMFGSVDSKRRGNNALDPSELDQLALSAILSRSLNNQSWFHQLIAESYFLKKYKLKEVNSSSVQGLGLRTVISLIEPSGFLPQFVERTSDIKALLMVFAGFDHMEYNVIEAYGADFFEKLVSKIHDLYMAGRKNSALQSLIEMYMYRVEDTLMISDQVWTESLSDRYYEIREAISRR